MSHEKKTGSLTASMKYSGLFIIPLCSLLPSASGFGVGFGYLNTEPNRVFGALGINP